MPNKLPELELKLQALGGLPRKAMGPIMRTGATTIWQDMLPRIPVDSGDLKKALSRKGKTVRAGKRSRTSVTFTVRMPERSALPKQSEDAKGYYPAAVEYGSRKLGRRNARPFMRPAFDAKKEQVKRQARADIAKAIIKLGRKGVR